MHRNVGSPAIVGRWRRVASSLVLLLTLGHVLAVGVAAAPNPATNKNAILLTFHCSSGDIVVATIAQNAAIAGQVVGGDGGTLVQTQVTAYDNPAFTGEPLFSFGAKGFDNNKLETETCTVLDNPNSPGVYYLAEVMVVPAQ